MNGPRNKDSSEQLQEDIDSIYGVEEKEEEAEEEQESSDAEEKE